MDHAGYGSRWSSGASSTRSSTTRCATSSRSLAPARSSGPTSSPRSAASTRGSRLPRRREPVLARPHRRRPGDRRPRRRRAAPRGAGQAPRLRRAPPAPGPPPAAPRAELLRAARALRAIVQTAVLNVVEVVYALLAGRRRRAGDIGSAWWWNLRRIGDLRAARAAGAGLPSACRTVRCGGPWPGAAPGCNQFLRGQIGRGRRPLQRSGPQRPRRRGRPERSGARAGRGTVWAVVAVVLLAGSRHLITRGVPAVGELVAFSQSPVDLFRAWFSGWRTAGLGAETPAPTAFGAIGGLGRGLLRRHGAAATVLTVGMIPLGAFFAYRLPGPPGRAGPRSPACSCTSPCPCRTTRSPPAGGARSCSTPRRPSLLGRPRPGQRRPAVRAHRRRPGPALRRARARQLCSRSACVTALVAIVLPVAVVDRRRSSRSALALGGGDRRDATRRAPAAGRRRGRGARRRAPPRAVEHRLRSCPARRCRRSPGVAERPAPSDLADLLRFEVGPLGSAPLGVVLPRRRRAARS